MPRHRASHPRRGGRPGCRPALLGGMAAVVLSTTGAAASDAVTCRGEGGAAVAWWMLYKQPNGVTYAYMDSTTASAAEFAVDTTADLGTSSSAPGRTLAPVFEAAAAARKGGASGSSGSRGDSASGVAYIAYNDENPNGQTDSVKAHAKGVLGVDVSDGSGFWLIHSVPKYPNFESTAYTYSGSEIYGQSFLCISLAAGGAAVDTAAEVLRHDGPYIYSSANVGDVGSDTMSALLDGDYLDGTVVREITADHSNFGGHNDSTSKDGSGGRGGGSGATFTVFGKSASWASDLYEDLVEPTLGLPFRWETWRRSGQDTDCTFNSSAEFDTMNVEYMEFVDAATGDALPAFRYTKDHSKVGVAASRSPDPWVCVGDINRMDSQSKRGGGTACLANAVLYDAIAGAVFISDACAASAKPSTDNATASATANRLRARAPGAVGAAPSSAPLNYSALQCDCTPNPFGSLPSLAQSRLQHDERARGPAPLAVCNNDGGWLNSTAECAAKSAAAAACVDAVRAAPPATRTAALCGCISTACRPPGRQEVTEQQQQQQQQQLTLDGGHGACDAAAAARAPCHARCWSDAQSSCADADDLHSACVFYCEDYCLARACDSDGAGDDGAAPSGTAAGAEEAEGWAGALRHRLCTRRCAREHMDRWWHTARAGEHYGDYAMCMLQC